MNEMMIYQNRRKNNERNRVIAEIQTALVIGGRDFGFVITLLSCFGGVAWLD